MKMHKLIVFVVLLALVAGCPARKDGAVEGVVTPVNSGARVTAMQDGKTVAVVDVTAPDGKFTLPLPPGSYDIQVTAPAVPLPVTFPAVAVEPAKTTTLPSVDLTAPRGTAALSGRIAEPVSGALVTLVSEGKERAAVQPDSQGNYRFAGLPAGRYTMEVSAPGYATDSLEFALADGRTTVQNLRLLYATSLPGVDWTAGVIKATGVGMPPKNAPNATVRREMAKRAAIADAQRNLVRIVDQMQIGPGRALKEFLGAGTYIQIVQGFVQGYRVTAERERKDGSFEVDIELPLSGSRGLHALVRER